jgi:hypothetical protein
VLPDIEDEVAVVVHVELARDAVAIGIAAGTGTPVRTAPDPAERACAERNAPARSRTHTRVCDPPRELARHARVSVPHLDPAELRSGPDAQGNAPVFAPDDDRAEVGALAATELERHDRRWRDEVKAPSCRRSRDPPARSQRDDHNAFSVELAGDRLEARSGCRSGDEQADGKAGAEHACRSD